MFNLLAVIVLLPLERATGILESSAKWVSERLVGADGETFESPIKAVVERPSEALIDVIDGLASGTALGILLIVAAMVTIFMALGFITRNMRIIVATRIERSVSMLLEKGGGMAADRKSVGWGKRV